MIKKTTAKLFTIEIIEHFLGKDWIYVEQISPQQVNTIALEQIKKKYPKGKFRRIKK